MKVPSILLSVFLPTLAFPALVRSADEVLSVAVFDFFAAPEVEGKGEDVSTLLTTLLSTDPGLILVERAELSKVLGEFEASLSGTIDPQSAAKVGHLTGADVLITGRMFRTGDEIFLAAKTIGVETGRVFGELTKFKQGEPLSDPVTELAEKLAKRVTENGASFRAASETPEARLVRLKKLVEGKKLPAVYVSIPEQHLSRQVPDPAAQTEIQKTLQDLGFPLVDKESVAEAVISGEAFSELGARHANIVSCRARIEVVIKQKAKGDRIHVDRETSVAADLSEHIAAKSALQRAGSDLVERLIPAILE